MDVDKDAKNILEYMRLNMPLEPCDVILGLGCLDTRVAERSAQLMLDGYGDVLIFSGGYGKITKDTNSKTEAETFRDTALMMGVPSEKIYIETQATNTGDNIKFSQVLIKENAINTRSMLVVTKPYMERRVYATFKKQWAGEDTKLIVTSPQLSYEEHFNDVIPKDLFLNVVVGDLQRIKEFPKLGFQIEQDIPDDVWHSYENLVKSGYTKQLLK